MSIAYDQKTSPIESDPRWSRVLSRDGAADGTFVYAVRTTGIYCRPSCPARTAKPRNVRFFSTPADAEAAGYRACRRCHPNGRSCAELIATGVASACRLIEQADGAPRLDALAAAVGLSPSYFHRQFRALTGLTPKEYATAHRAKRVRAGLAECGISVTEAIYAAGFSSSSRFYEKSDEVLGMTPTEFKKGGDGATIRFAVGQCSLGVILAARSPKGVCAVTLGDGAFELIRDLRERFPNATLIGGDKEFDERVAEAVSFVDASQAHRELPLDIRCTAFQRRVWRALRDNAPMLLAPRAYAAAVNPELRSNSGGRRDRPTRCSRTGKNARRISP